MDIYQEALDYLQSQHVAGEAQTSSGVQTGHFVSHIQAGEGISEPQENLPVGVSVEAGAETDEDVFQEEEECCLLSPLDPDTPELPPTPVSPPHLFLQTIQRTTATPVI